MNNEWAAQYLTDEQKDEYNIKSHLCFMTLIKAITIYSTTAAGVAALGLNISTHHLFHVLSSADRDEHRTILQTHRLLLHWT